MSNIRRVGDMADVSSPSSEEIAVVYDNSVDEIKAIDSDRQPILFPAAGGGGTPTLQQVLDQGSTGQVVTTINIQAVEKTASLSSYDDTGGAAISILDLDATDTGSVYISLRNENEDGDFQELEFNSPSSGVGSMIVRDEVKSKGLENAADYSANSSDRSLIDKAEIKGLIAINKTANSTFLVEVTQASDLPSTLVANTTYLIRGSITLTTAISVTDTGCSIIGLDRQKDKLIWNGLTGTTMLTITDVDFDLSNVGLSANNTGAVLIAADNYDAASFNSGRTKVFTIDNCQFKNCFDIASFEGFDLIDISNTLFWYVQAPNFGIKFLNTSKIQISSCEFIRWFDESTIPTPSGYATCPMIEFLTDGGGSGLGAVNIGGCVIHPQQTQDGIKINSGSTTGFGTISSNTFVDVNLTTGLKFFPNPLTGGYSNTECLNYDVAVNQGVPNSTAYMLCTFTGNTNDTDLSTGTPAPIECGGLATDTNSQRFTLTNTTIGGSANVTPVLEYIGTKPVFESLTVSLSYDKQGGGTDPYIFSFFLDSGSGYALLPNSELDIDAGADSDELTITLVYANNFSNGDKVAIFCENPSSGDDILIKSMQWLIKE